MKGFIPRSSSVKRSQIKEVDIQSSILEGLTLSNIGLFWRNNNVAVYDKKMGAYRSVDKYFLYGASDIFGLVLDKFIAIEVKTKTSYLKADGVYRGLEQAGHKFTITKSEMHFAEQAAFLLNVNKRGHLGFFTFSLHHCIDKLKEFFGDRIKW